MRSAKTTALRTLLLLGAVLTANLCLVSTALGAVVTIDGVTYTTSNTTASVTGYTGALPTNVTIPSTISSGGTVYTVTSVGGWAFSNATGLRSIVLPNTVTSIGNSGFDGASNLQSITVPDGVSSIGTYAFSGTGSLTSFTIPSSLTSISRGMFQGSGLTGITIPSTVTSIGSYVFNGTNGLTHITIPSSVTSLGDWTFFYSSHLTRLEFLGDQPCTCSNSLLNGTQATVYRFANASGWPAIGSTWNGKPQAYLVLPSAAPTAVAGDTSATITVTPPASGPTPDTYTVAAVSDGSKTCTVTAPATSCVVSGLTNGTSYTFTAVANTASPVASSVASGASNAVTPQLSAPNAPGTPTAIAGDAQATVTVTAGVGSAPDTYLVTAVQDNTKTCTVTVPATSCTITGLTNGTSYTFTATATNLAGTSGASSASAAISPTAAVVPPTRSESSGTSSSTAPAPAPTTALTSASSAILRLTSTRVTPDGTAVITTFTAPSAGSVHHVGTIRTGRRNARAATITVCTYDQAINAAGVTHVTCNLNNAGRRLRTQQALVITLTTTYTPISGTPLVSTKSIRLPRTNVAKAPAQTSTVPSSVTG
ncbi:MAG: leucine-rich repeat protein [Thermoleophilia bacterium]